MYVAGDADAKVRSKLMVGGRGLCIEMSAPLASISDGLRVLDVDIGELIMRPTTTGM